MDLIYVFALQDRKRLKAFVSKAIQLRIPRSAGNLLTN
jgi:hypothetical protein